jgi:prepilin-type N-terminal cleavage/methylation domain-containing protein
MNNKGFSLVELSVVISIIAIIISGALTIATKKSESDKLDETEYKISQIQNSIHNFIIDNERLPCTANGELRTDNTNFAKEEANPTLNSGHGQCSQSNFSNGNIFYGIVPTRTLGLNDDMLLDGWGNRLSYIIDANFAHNETTNPSCNGGVAINEDVCFRHNENGSINIIHSNTPLINKSNGAVYAIISHGKNGSGAYSNAGTRIISSNDEDEQENAGDDEGSFDGILAQKDKTQTYDDIVIYKRKWSILSDIGYVSDADLCDEASDGLNKCINAEEPVDCQEILNK